MGHNLNSPRLIEMIRIIHSLIFLKSSGQFEPIRFIQFQFAIHRCPQVAA